MAAVGQRRTCPLTDQASESALVGDLCCARKQKIDHLARADPGALEREDNEVDGTSAEPNSPQSTMPVIRWPSPSTFAIQVVVGEVASRKPQPRGWLKPRTQADAQRGRRHGRTTCRQQWEVQRGPLGLRRCAASFPDLNRHRAERRL